MGPNSKQGTPLQSYVQKKGKARQCLLSVCHTSYWYGTHTIHKMQTLVLGHKYSPRYAEDRERTQQHMLQAYKSHMGAYGMKETRTKKDEIGPVGSK